MLNGSTIFILAVIAFVAIFLGGLIARRIGRQSGLMRSENNEQYHAIDDKEGLKAARKAYERNQRSKRRQVFMAIVGVIMLFIVWLIQIL